MHPAFGTQRSPVQIRAARPQSPSSEADLAELSLTLTRFRSHCAPTNGGESSTNWSEEASRSGGACRGRAWLLFRPESSREPPPRALARRAPTRVAERDGDLRGPLVRRRRSASPGALRHRGRGRCRTPRAPARAPPGRLRGPERRADHARCVVEQVVAPKHGRAERRFLPRDELHRLEAANSPTRSPRPTHSGTPPSPCGSEPAPTATRSPSGQGTPTPRSPSRSTGTCGRRTTAAPGPRSPSCRVARRCAGWQRRPSRRRSSARTA